MTLTKFQLMLLILLIGLFQLTSGCVVSRSVRSTEDEQMDFLRAELKECLSSEKGVLVDFFVLHSEWFEYTKTVCRNQLDADCWIESLSNLIDVTDSSYDEYVSCINQFVVSATAALSNGKRKRNIKQNNIKPKTTRVRRSVARSRPPPCPSYDPKVLKKQLQDLSISLSNTNDTTIESFDELLAQFANLNCFEEVCSMDNIYRDANYTPSFRYYGSLTCDYLMISGSVRQASSLASPLAVLVTSKIETTSITCFPQTNIRIDSESLQSFKATSMEDQLVIGPQKYCSQGTDAPEVVADECKPTIVESKSGNSTFFTFPTLSCGAEVEETSTSTIFKYTVNFVPAIGTNDVIGRFTCPSIILKCELNTKGVIGNLAPTRIVPTIETFISERVDEKDSYALSFDATTKGGTITAPVDAGDYIEASITLINVKTTSIYQLRASNCFASLSNNRANLSAVYPILDCIGCKENNSYDPNDAIVVESNDNFEVKFKFQSFIWNDVQAEDQIMFLHCSVNVCNTNVQTCNATKNCSLSTNCPSKSRRRRSVKQDEDTWMRFGPIVLVDKFALSKDITKECEINNGGCEDICKEETGSVRCLCKAGKVLGSDSKSCFTTDPSNEEINQSSQFVVFTSAILNHYPLVSNIASLCSIFMLLSVVLASTD